MTDEEITILRQRIKRSAERVVKLINLDAPLQVIENEIGYIQQLIGELRGEKTH